MNVSDLLPADLFAGTVVFVTGGGSGINLGIASTFATLGADIGLCGRSQDKLDRARGLLEPLGARVVARAADVRDADALRAAIEATGNELGPIGVLVCGAAGNFPCPAERLSPNGFKSVVDIDLLGSFNTCHAAFEQLKTTRGSIVFISAGMALIPYAAQAHVGAAKAGVDNLMRNLALEWGRFGIRSNSIVPGPIADTEGMRRLAAGDDELHRRLQAAIPLGRYGTVEEIGHAAAFLASPLAAFVTGTVLVVDGGQNLPGSGPFNAMLAEALARSQ